MLNIFDLRLTTATEQRRLSDELEKLRALNSTQGLQIRDQIAELNELRTAAASAENRLSASQERESALQKQITDLKSELARQETAIAKAQQGRIDHNDLLLKAGKAWVAFKSAWQFRIDNPKMNPRERAANNEQLRSAIDTVDTWLPKQIADPNVAQVRAEMLSKSKG